LQKITFRNKKNFEKNIEKSYVCEYQIRGFLHNVESLKTYSIQYANQKKIENEKHIQLFQFFWEKYPYLDSNMNNEEIMFTCETHVNEDTSNILKYVQHDFKDEIKKFVLNDDQLKIFDILINETKGLHVLEGTPRSGKNFFVKYLTRYFQT